MDGDVTVPELADLLSEILASIETGVSSAYDRKLRAELRQRARDAILQAMGEKE